MNESIKGAKLARLQTILLTQADKQRLVDKIKERYSTAEEIIVVDPQGLYFHYFPVLAGQTHDQALAKTPLSIPKTMVDEFNAEAQGALLEGEDPIDFDSLEILTGQLDHWVTSSILKADMTFGVDDQVELIASYGLPELGKFILGYAKNGFLDPNAPVVQKRFTNVRTDINIKIENNVVEEELTVTKLSLQEAATQLADLINGDIEDDGSVPFLYPEDIKLPVTHLKIGQTYIATITSASLDFYGQFDFTVTLPAPVVP